MDNLSCFSFFHTFNRFVENKLDTCLIKFVENVENIKIPLLYSHLFVDNFVESLLKIKKQFLLFIFSTNWVTLVVIYLS